MNRKTLDDMPSIMNSISYHLKRIADQLEDHNDLIEQSRYTSKQDVMDSIKPSTSKQDVMDSILNKLKSS